MKFSLYAIVFRSLPDVSRQLLPTAFQAIDIRSKNPKKRTDVSCKPGCGADTSNSSNNGFLALI